MSLQGGGEEVLESSIRTKITILVILEVVISLSCNYTVYIFRYCPHQWYTILKFFYWFNISIGIVSPPWCDRQKWEGRCRETVVILEGVGRSSIKLTKIGLDHIRSCFSTFWHWHISSSNRRAPMHFHHRAIASIIPSSIPNQVDQCTSIIEP